MTKDIIKFTKPSGRYNAGDVAGFDPVTADGYKAAGVAVTYVKPSTSVAALATGTEEGMAQVREYARSEQARLGALADGIQQREGEINAQLDERTRALDAREQALAEREAALDQGPATGGTATAATGTAPVIAADQVGPMPPNGATPPTGEGHEGEATGADTVKGDEGKDDLPAQGAAKKAK